jgi:excisionase family DNA binding protein
MIEILTPDELADLVRLSPNKIILLARRGELPFVILDGKIRFDAQDVEDWINARKIGSAPAPLRVVNPDIEEMSKGKKPQAALRKHLASEAGSVLALREAAKKKE